MEVPCSGFAVSNFPEWRLRRTGIFTAITDAKKIAATYNLLREKNIDSLDKLNEVITETKTEMKDMYKQIRNIDGMIANINETVKYLDRAHSNKTTWDDYIKSRKSSDFYESHLTDLMCKCQAEFYIVR